VLVLTGRGQQGQAGEVVIAGWGQSAVPVVVLEQAPRPWALARDGAWAEVQILLF
jgi:hypothetical protein